MTEIAPSIDSTKSADPKKRGVGFPALPLQEAVDAVVLAGQHGPDHTYDAFATYLNHQTTNSGAFRSKLASLRDWGLITRGAKDRVALSGLAQDLVLAVPQHYEAKSLLLTAFESCRVFGMLYNDSAKGVPMDITRLRSTALMRYAIAPDQADRFVDSFIQSAVFAGLADSDGNKVRLHPRDSVFSGNATLDDEAESLTVGTGVPPTKALTSALAPPTTAAGTPIALRQAWPIDGGEIEFVIRTAKAMPPRIYALMAEMAVTAERMENLLRAPEPNLAVRAVGQADDEAQAYA